jgi:hypothetical protein
LLAANRASTILGKHFLLALNTNNIANAEQILAAGADINFKNNPAVAIALNLGRFTLLENILAEENINITRFKSGAEDTALLIAAAAEQLKNLVTLTKDRELALANDLSEKLFTSFVSLFKLGLSKEILYQILVLQYEGVSFFHWIAEHNKDLMYAALSLLSEMHAGK